MAKPDYQRYTEMFNAMDNVKTATWYYLADHYLWSPSRIAKVHNVWSRGYEKHWAVIYRKHDVTQQVRKYAERHCLRVPGGCRRKRPYKRRER